MHHASEQVEGILELLGARARWIGHQLHAEADIAIEPGLSVREGVDLVDRFRTEVIEHLPALASLHVSVVERQKPGIVAGTERRTA
jgi:divalent metal cation (Fe/Co/Zn/Cd) transporter